MSKELAIEIFPTILVLQFSKPSEVVASLQLCFSFVKTDDLEYEISHIFFFTWKGDESNQDIYLGKKDKFVKFWDHFDGLTNTELKKVF